MLVRPVRQARLARLVAVAVAVVVRLLSALAQVMAAAAAVRLVVARVDPAVIMVVRALDCCSLTARVCALNAVTF